MQKKLVIAGLIIIAISLGFLRDHVFVFINYLIETGGDPEGKLSMLKWVLTLLFSLAYLMNTCALLFVFFRSQKYIRIAVLSYSFLFAAALLSAATSCIFSSFGNVYPFVRTILGVAQSPVVMMILIPICFFDRSVTRE